MNTFKEIWRKLTRSKGYRKEFFASLLKRGTAMQIQSLMKQRKWTQAQLAEQSGLTQGVISRAKNPAYGNLTFNTVIDIAAGFDVAFIGRFVPFSELARWLERMPEELSFEMASFEEENSTFEKNGSLEERKPLALSQATMTAQQGASRNSKPNNLQPSLFPDLNSVQGIGEVNSANYPAAPSSAKIEPEFHKALFLVYDNPNPKKAVLSATNPTNYQWNATASTRKPRHRRLTHARTATARIAR